MGRPQPTIILESITEDNEVLQVCSSDTPDNIYAVVYQGQPINLRNKPNIEIDYPGWKYPKTIFVHPGHAAGLARRLNHRFNTEDFTVAIYRQARLLK